MTTKETNKTIKRQRIAEKALWRDRAKTQLSFMALLEVAHDAERLLTEIANKVPLSDYGINTLNVRTRLQNLLTCPSDKA